MQKNKLLSTLKNLIVLGDFKSAKGNFLAQGIDKDTIAKYFTAFKKLRDSHRIQEENKKNIDYWATLKFDELKKFVDTLTKKTSKRQEKKITRKAPWQFEYVEGATNVAENNDWVVYKIGTYEAAKKLGTLNWCIVRDESTWKDYAKTGIFYFYLSKKFSYEEEGRSSSGHIAYTNPYHRIARYVARSPYSEKKEQWYDAVDRLVQDNALIEIKNENMPSFEIEIPEPLFHKLINQIREEGLTDDIRNELYEFTGIDFKKYNKEKDFLISSEYNDFEDLVKHETTKHLKWLQTSLEFIDIDTHYSERDIQEIVETFLDLIQKKDKNLYTKIVDTVLKENANDFIENVIEREDYISSDELEDVDNKLEFLKKHRQFNNMLKSYLIESSNDLAIIFERMHLRATESATQVMIIKRLLGEINDSGYILLQEKESLWYPIKVGIYLGVLADLDPTEVQGEINDHVANLGFDQYDYEYPSESDLGYQVEDGYELEEWFAEHK